ncbi:MAG: hypothetical protein GX246_04845 [Clostridiales bacterium]|nr:VOC family protein [Bacillota bacterium]NLL54462.1 hypothetical protein [Clostridiales bacterium]
MKKVCSLLLIVFLLMKTGIVLAEQTSVPANEGISRICASVFDLAESEMFFTEVMELTKVGEGTLEASVVHTLYGLDCDARYVMLKNEVQTTLLQLIEFSERPQKTSRQGYRTWDYGYYDIAFRCADIQKVYADLSAQGYEFPCPPYQYVTTWSGTEVFEAVMYGPNDMPLALINKTANTPEFEGMFRNFPDVVLVVDNMDTADRFYVDVLGMSKVFDMEMEKGLVDPIVGTVGTDIVTRIGMYMGGGATPIIEILDYSEEGVSMTEEGASVPGNAGIFATCFMVENVDAILESAAEQGFAASSETLEMELAPYGVIRTALVSGPNGSLVEIFEIL